MSQNYVKNALKLAKDALQVKHYEEALKNCEKVLQYEPDNYNAYVFLGVIYQNLNRLEESLQAYQKAIEINSLKNIYIFFIKDVKNILDTINKLINLHRDKQRNRLSHVAVLKYMLPGSPCFEMIQNLEGVPKPIQTFSKIRELLEIEESETLVREVERRRQRLNAGPHVTIKAQVENEVYSNSQLEEIYESLLELAPSDDYTDSNDITLKYVAHIQKKLMAVLHEEKSRLREKLHLMARILVKQNTDSPLPYEILIESTDSYSSDDYDENLLREYSEKFPDAGLSIMIRGYFLHKNGGLLDEAIELYNEGFALASNSLFGHLSISWLYHNSKDYDSALEYAMAGHEHSTNLSKLTGVVLKRYQRSLDLCIANCYLNLGSRHYTDALPLYQKILNQDPYSVSALLGISVIFSHQKQYTEALATLDKALKLEPDNHLVQGELAWIQFSLGNLEEAERMCAEAIKMSNSFPLHYYRLGRIYWEKNGEYRSDKNYAYNQFIQAIKLDPHLANAFTFIGHYYRLIASDSIRAKKCYEKAFSLEANDEEAGLQLSHYYQSDGKPELAEAVYRTAIQANFRAAWAWKRLGFLELTKQNNIDAITAFQTALRSDTKDIHCWEGLAEAYRQEGRFIASMKAFIRATELDPFSIYAYYQIANIKQRLGLYNDAIDQYKLIIKKAETKGQPNHLPSLKGCGDCYLALAIEYYHNGYYGRSADALAEGLENMLRAVQINNSIQSLWKLIGDICFTAKLIPSYLHLIPLEALSQIIEITNTSDIDRISQMPKGLDSTGFNKDMGGDFENDTLTTFLKGACVAYKYAIYLNGNNSDINSAYWHDLAISYYWLFVHMKNSFKKFSQENFSVYLNIAISCIKGALRLEPTNHNFWNDLGVITSSINTKLSQHAFIMAMDYSPKDPVSWTNIGFLYLMNSDSELANQAFTAAHTLDPDFAPAWFGQAYVAKLLGSEEALDLFEHAFDISGPGDLVEGNYGFACQSFKHICSKTFFEDTSLVSPLFALQKLIEQRPDDIAALNLSGLMLEQLYQSSEAAEAFANAIKTIEETLHNSEGLCDIIQAKYLDCLQANLGRVLCAIGDFTGSIAAHEAALKAMEGRDFGSFQIYSQLGAGLAYYFSNQLKNSLEMFENALNATEVGLGIEEVHKDVVVLLSQVLWALRGEEHRNLAKEELFRCISNNPSHLPAILGLCAMGLIQEDNTLANAALQEITKLPLHVTYEIDQKNEISFLLSRYFLLQGSEKQATLSLIRSVQVKPTDLVHWLNLTDHLISIGSFKPAVSSAKSTLVLVSNPSSLAALSITTIQKFKLYCNFATALIANSAENEVEEPGKVTGEIPTDDPVFLTQRALVLAPWNLLGWSLLGIGLCTRQNKIAFHSDNSI
ncbi:hypothetical protein G9A89_020169 [Geosiphon pyriformis]|nr:hypothetical protein G9A89_020169 [Geosiphon pyriformis]